MQSVFAKFSYCLRNKIPICFFLSILSTYATYRTNKSHKLLSRPASHTVQDSGVQCMHLFNTEKRNDFLETTAEIFFHILARTQIFPAPH
jgi:hypothetical protein